MDLGLVIKLLSSQGLWLIVYNQMTWDFAEIGYAFRFKYQFLQGVVRDSFVFYYYFFFSQYTFAM